MAIPAAQLGWMAGVIDLRGKIIYKNNVKRVTPQVVLMVESKQRGVIDELCRLTGTMVEWQNRVSGAKSWFRRGCTEHCPDEHVHVEVDNLPEIARWTITGAAMAALIWNIAPFLRNKQTELTEVMAAVFGDMVLSGRGSGATLAALNRLSKLGWDMPPEVYQKMVAAAMAEQAVTTDAA